MRSNKYRLGETYAPTYYMPIGIGLTVGWQFRISTPESFE